ncbi:hypothetical protein DIZ81_06335 [Legionella taurinensis]|uniref:Transmembrane cytochrome oxidase associated protein n=1 Tax=Legionella taurinensis TaxID=70611 RepID=A0A3A5LDJ4_9GAMM|nr:hypothetical protein [Legionella taurinensis]MDX1837537.1 hypothetical protein [Legionella taurinensis]PUT40874.1 hypothetical protein DB744_06335 [Legionella taurinensis]PUT44295.1 hypothetical protein DB746_04735 [Legionella taurinensis]PUT47597.1 hypothetical protein DB743_02905 [Legionella taurinensis]PUT48736.1 hypothetical protein DB745_04735 [Legionella taurinensis]
MKKTKNQKLALILLALMFAAPAPIAYLFFKHPQWLGAQTNKGELLKPAVSLNAINNKEKWHLLLWHPGRCDSGCSQQIERLARVRLALGRRLYEVEQWLVINDSDPALPAALLNALHEQDIHVLRLNQAQRQVIERLTGEDRVFIADPNNYLILSYGLTAKSEDIFHDLKQLLTTVEKKSS